MFRFSSSISFANFSAFSCPLFLIPLTINLFFITLLLHHFYLFLFHRLFYISLYDFSGVYKLFERNFIIFLLSLKLLFFNQIPDSSITFFESHHFRFLVPAVSSFNRHLIQLRISFSIHAHFLTNLTLN